MRLPVSENRSASDPLNPLRALIFSFLIASLSSACYGQLSNSKSARVPPPEKKQVFTDVTRQAGITWKQFAGESPDKFLIETMGGGVAFLDFDGDGLLDIFLVNGGETPHGKRETPVRNALYRN